MHIEDFWHYVANSDEVTLLLEISSLLTYLSDVKVMAVVIVSIYSILWYKLECLAATRAETERRQAETNYDCQGRPSLRNFCFEKNGELYGNFNFFETLIHFLTSGWYKLHIHESVSMRSAGIVWKTPSLTVHAQPVNSILLAAARQFSSKNIEQAMQISRTANFTLNFDDPDAFLNFYTSETKLKKSNFISAKELIKAVFDFEKKTVSCGGLVMRGMSQEVQSCLAILTAHLTLTDSN